MVQTPSKAPSSSVRKAKTPSTSSKSKNVNVIPQASSQEETSAPVEETNAEEEEEEIALFHPSIQKAAAARKKQDEENQAKAKETLKSTSSLSAASNHTADTKASALAASAHQSSSSTLSSSSTSSTSSSSTSSSTSTSSLDSSELMTCLTSLSSSLSDFHSSSLSSLLSRATDNFSDLESGTKHGLSFLDMKMHLMLDYMIHNCLIILNKLENVSLQHNPLVERLVYLRVLQEKLKPLDKKMKYSIEKLLLKAQLIKVSEDGEEQREQANADADPFASDPLSFKPNTAALAAAISGKGSKTTSKKSARAADDENEDDDDDVTAAERANYDDEAEEKDNVYRPPKITPTSFDSYERGVSREARRLERMRSSLSSSSFMKDLRQEISDRPEEVQFERDAANAHLSREDQERLEFEEKNMMRLMDTKQDKKRKKKQERDSLHELNGLNDFDDLRDLERMSKSVNGKNKRGLAYSDDMDDIYKMTATVGKKQKRKNDWDEMGESYDEPQRHRRMKSGGKGGGVSTKNASFKKNKFKGKRH